MRFDWTINIGNLFTLLALVAASIGFLMRHLQALQGITEALDSVKDTLEEMQREMRGIEHRLTRTETLLETILPPRGST